MPMFDAEMIDSRKKEGGEEMLKEVIKVQREAKFTTSSTLPTTMEEEQAFGLVDFESEPSEKGSNPEKKKKQDGATSKFIR